MFKWTYITRTVRIYGLFSFFNNPPKLTYPLKIYVWKDDISFLKRSLFKEVLFVACWCTIFWQTSWSLPRTSKEITVYSYSHDAVWANSSALAMILQSNSSADLGPKMNLVGLVVPGIPCLPWVPPVSFHVGWFFISMIVGERVDVVSKWRTSFFQVLLRCPKWRSLNPWKDQLKLPNGSLRRTWYML